MKHDLCKNELSAIKIQLKKNFLGSSFSLIERIIDSINVWTFTYAQIQWFDTTTLQVTEFNEGHNTVA